MSHLIFPNVSVRKGPSSGIKQSNTAYNQTSHFVYSWHGVKSQVVKMHSRTEPSDTVENDYS